MSKRPNIVLPYGKLRTTLNPQKITFVGTFNGNTVVEYSTRGQKVYYGTDVSVETVQNAVQRYGQVVEQPAKDKEPRENVVLS